MLDHTCLIDLDTGKNPVSARLSIEDIKKLSDTELLSILSGDAKLNGMMEMPLLQLIVSELQSRSIEKASKPHWSVTPNFLVGLVAMIASCFAAYYSYVAYYQDHKHVAQDIPTSKISQDDQKSSAKPRKQSEQALPQLSKTSKN